MGSRQMRPVLSIWTERRKPSEVCRELGIKWANLSHWQDRALEAMMAALEPRTSREKDRGPALGPKLEKLLEKATKRSRQMGKLERRLEKIQQAAPPSKTVSEKRPCTS